MRLFFLILMLVIAVVALIIGLRTPRTDRDWQAPLSRAPLFGQTENGRWAIDHLRAFEFAPEGAAVAEWRPVEIDPAALQEIWFFVEPFESWDAVAHSFVSFVFDGETPQTISVSVEARKEEGEDYSALRGAFNAYELLYVWSTEKDILTRIAVHLDHELYAYRLDVSPEQARAILEHFIARTNRLIERPRFYNTLTSNCTNELAKAVNDAFPGSLPWRRSHVFTGRSAEYLHRLGFLEGGKDFEAIRATAEIRSAVHAAKDLPDGPFAAQWRAQKHQNAPQETR